MAVTRYGLTGPMTAYGEFLPKAASTVAIAAVLEDLTTLWCQDWQPDIHALNQKDDTTRLRIDLDDNVLGYDSEQDLPTALAKYIDTEH